MDKHCHLERRFRKINSLEDCIKMDEEDLRDKFLECIINYCQPSERSQGSKLTDLLELLRTIAKDVYFYQTNKQLEQLVNLLKLKTSMDINKIS